MREIKYKLSCGCDTDKAWWMRRANYSDNMIGICISNERPYCYWVPSPKYNLIVQPLGIGSNTYCWHTFLGIYLLYLFYNVFYARYPFRGRRSNSVIMNFSYDWDWPQSTLFRFAKFMYENTPSLYLWICLMCVLLNKVGMLLVVLWY